MEEYQQRVIKEKATLDQKRDLLIKFLTSERTTSVDEKELTRLKKQAMIMAEYSDILQERITAFTK